jgi:hypothetical protein
MKLDPHSKGNINWRCLKRKILRKIYGSKGEEVTRRENYATMNFISCGPAQHLILLGSLNEE